MSIKPAVIGLGSGGSAVADMLARYGVDELTIVDPDRLTEDNCKRHILTRDAVGENKALAMAMHLSQITDADIYIQDNKFGEYDGPKGMDHFLKEPDVIACCADSDQCCQLVNAYALSRKIPVVYGAVHGDAHTAEIITVFPGITPCYACYEREGELPPPTQEHYTDPNHDPTKMPHQEGLWCDVLMAASIQFRAILKVMDVRKRIEGAKEAYKEKQIIYGCFGELWTDMNPLILTSLRPPYGSEIIRQKRGCSICTEDFSRLAI